ncbi:MAG: FG-GAP-like repeat-containing protein [Actinomycetota bacterium]|nr:FG-GAP-like repeat-containing protein [Actinomycetota bacterium]
MPENKNRLIMLCRQTLVAGTVLAVAVPAASMVSLDIVAPHPQRPVGDLSGRPATASLVATEPVRPDVSEVPVEGVDPAGLDAVTHDARKRQKARQQLAALSAPAPVTGYATVGVTWDEGAIGDDEYIAVSVRTFEDGDWSAWEAAEYDPEHGPDPWSVESSKIRSGTEPIVVGEVDEVQVKATTDSGEAPQEMAVVIVDPGETAASAVEQPAIDTAIPGETDGSASLASADTALAAASVSKPRIYSRAQWGADERMRDPGSLRYGTISAGFVHHTVNANGYTAEQVPALLRGIYAYHTQSQGWSDIGYNFLVDRFGRIWEGRYGGVDRPVVGAHTLGYNEYSFAMSAVGNFDIAQPSAAMLDAYGRLFAWKLSLHGVNAASTRQRVGSSYFEAINGHRDAGQTACPGRYLYAKLPAIRTLARKYQTETTDPEPPPEQEPPVEPKRSADLAGSSWPDLAVRDKVSDEISVVRTGGQLAFEPGEPAGQNWDGMDLIAGSRDLTGDGIADMVARDKGSKSTGIYPGDGTGGFQDAAASTGRFSGSDQLTSVSDFDGDGNNDLVARTESTRALFLYPGDGHGGFSTRRRLSSEWNYNRTLGVGDLDGDGTFDLAARNRAGTLDLFSGTSAALGQPRRLPGQWDVFDILTGIGDLTNDGKGDLVARNATSKLTYIYPGDGRGGLRERVGPFHEFKDLDFLTAPGQVAGSRRSDLVGRQPSGRLVGFTNTGRKNISGIDDTGEVVDTADLLLNVGDWNGDGNGDLMTRSASSGRMYLRKGDGKSHFGQPVLAGPGWGSVSAISPVGDVTGDGREDLVGRPQGGSMRTYPGDGSSGFLASRPAESSVTSRLSTGSTDRYDWMLNVGDANADKQPDLIAREKATGRLFLMPGTDEGFAPRRFIAEGFSSYDLGG